MFVFSYKIAACNEVGNLGRVPYFVRSEHSCLPFLTFLMKGNLNAFFPRQKTDAQEDYAPLYHRLTSAYDTKIACKDSQRTLLIQL